MMLGFILLGLVIGAYISSGGSFFMGSLLGAALGGVLARLINAERRISALEQALRQTLSRTPSEAAGQRSQPPTSTPVTAPAAPAVAPATGSRWVAPDPQASTQQEQAPARPAQKAKPPAGPSLATQWFRAAAGWLSTGNVPVKVGVIISFIGVAFLLKYAIDRELLVLPIEFRLLGVALAGMVLLGIGWRLRQSKAVYALSLQGGGIGILFLTIFAAFRIWQLLPGPLAFGLLAALAAGCGALAVLQKSRWLMMLGVTGAFLAPILTSTGQGNHVALFSYYLLINAAILGVSWFNAWRGLNLLGFGFTFLIGSLWGYRYYQPELLASSEPFLIAHFLLYTTIAILFALRSPADKKALVDGTLVFGTPVIAFSLQAGLMRGSNYGLAISAAVLALFYALTATWLQRREGSRQKLLIESLIALAVAFGTLAIPLALDARWTSAAWALEGAALVWVGGRQSRHLATLAGAGLVFFSGLSFAISGWSSHGTLPVLNSNVIGGLLISLAALFSARQLHVRAQAEGHHLLLLAYRGLGWLLFAWGVGWWFGTGIMEIDDRINHVRELHILILFVAASFAAAGWLAQAINWSMPRWLSVVYLPVLAMLALASSDTYRHPLTDWGWLAWPLAIAAQILILRILDSASRQDPAGAGTRFSGTWAGLWHAGSVLLVTALLAQEAAWRGSYHVGGSWGLALATAVPGLAALLIWKFRSAPNWPVPAHPVSYRGLSLALLGLQCIALLQINLSHAGDSSPLPYLPVLNPLDLAMGFAMLIAALALKVMRRDRALIANTMLSQWLPVFRVLLALSFWVLTTTTLLRAVHHWTGVPWEFHWLNQSTVVHMALSIYWGMLGFTGMIVGARKAKRGVWVAGAAFMGLVVIKLFLVDLGNSGTIERIVSFIGIGVLLLVVGYFAPAPPRLSAAPAAALNQEESS